MNGNQFFPIVLFSSDFISSVEPRGCPEDGRPSSHAIPQDTGGGTESLSSLGTARENVPRLPGDMKHTTAAFARVSSPEVCCCRHI